MCDRTGRLCGRTRRLSPADGSPGGRWVGVGTVGGEVLDGGVAGRGECECGSGPVRVPVAVGTASSSPPFVEIAPIRYGAPPNTAAAAAATITARARLRRAARRRMRWKAPGGVTR